MTLWNYSSQDKNLCNFHVFNLKCFRKIWTVNFLRTLGNLVQNITYFVVGKSTRASRDIYFVSATCMYTYSLYWHGCIQRRVYFFFRSSYWICSCSHTLRFLSRHLMLTMTYVWASFDYYLDKVCTFCLWFQKPNLTHNHK
jgi:hypothetical protein